MATGTDMTRGNYTTPSIRAVDGISPAGFDPDQFGIVQSPVGYSQIDDAWVFVVVGEQEMDTNGVGIFQAMDWRLQAFEAMSETGPRFEAFAQGEDTGHIDVSSNNPDVVAYNVANSLALFDTVLRGANRADAIGRTGSTGREPGQYPSEGPLVGALDIGLGSVSGCVKNSQPMAACA